MNDTLAILHLLALAILLWATAAWRREGQRALMTMAEDQRETMFQVIAAQHHMLETYQHELLHLVQGEGGYRPLPDGEADAEDPSRG